MSVDETNAVYLGGMPSLVTFLPGLSVQERQDLQDVLLDAQLFAGAHLDFEKQWSSWMHYYRSRLRYRGVHPQSLVMDDSLLVSSVEDLRRATFAIRGVGDHQLLGGLVRRSFEAAGIYQAAGAYFQSGSGRSRLGSFQIVPCAQMGNGQVLMLLCGLQLVADAYSAGGRRLLFFFKGGSYTFDSQTYAAHREDVIRYLGGKSKSMIRAIHI
ncbi:hypothetical protein V2K62_24075 [Pseudomonas alliivorans]|nr:hypothetical protein [Pseudomonas alliivorans]MEE4835966.1 hypothetical protein [Pseudomonas alliivorans]MEE4917161.1 hypothetical protein [Pseudomonas alliivorans]MEE4927613.1 hypothetical protein [Pseudomonas alliivorans]MEE5056162.1 hypothetical protein [Pseudomonas alliivorans]